MSKILSVGLLSFLLGSFFSQYAVADDTGLAKTLHTFSVERGKTCQVGHFHTSKGEGETKALALKDAQRTWMAFTSAEYGSDWGSFRRSANKIVRCVRDSGSDKCTVVARPCKRLVRRKHARYRRKSRYTKRRSRH